MSKKPELTQKEKADLYDNWLKYVANRGWTDCFAEPQKIKEKFDKLNKELESHKGTGIMLAKENQSMKVHYDKVIKKNEELRDEIKKLKERKKIDDSFNKLRDEQYDTLNEKLKKK